MSSARHSAFGGGNPLSNSKYSKILTIKRTQLRGTRLDPGIKRPADVDLSSQRFPTGLLPRHGGGSLASLSEPPGYEPLQPDPGEHHGAVPISSHGSDVDRRG